MAEMVKHLTTMRKTRVWSLGWQDSLEKEMAAHSSTLAWKIPRMQEPVSPWGYRVRHYWETSLSFYNLKLAWFVNTKDWASSNLFINYYHRHRFFLCICLRQWSSTKDMIFFISLTGSTTAVQWFTLLFILKNLYRGVKKDVKEEARK